MRVHVYGSAHVRWCSSDRVCHMQTEDTKFCVYVNKREVFLLSLLEQLKSNDRKPHIPSGFPA